MIDKEFMDKYLNYLNKIGCTEYKDILLSIGVANNYDLEDMLTSNDSEFNRLIGGTQGSGTLTEVGKYRLLNDLLYCITEISLRPSLQNSFKVKKIVKKNFEIKNIFKNQLDLTECRNQILNVYNTQDLDIKVCNMALELGKIVQNIETSSIPFIIGLPSYYKDFVKEHRVDYLKGCNIEYDDNIETEYDMLNLMLLCCLLKASNMLVGECLHTCVFIEHLKNSRKICIGIPSIIQGINAYEQLKDKNRVLYNNLVKIFDFDEKYEITFDKVKFFMLLLGHLDESRISELEVLKNECSR